MEKLSLGKLSELHANTVRTWHYAQIDSFFVTHSSKLFSNLSYTQWRQFQLITFALLSLFISILIQHNPSTYVYFIHIFQLVLGRKGYKESKGGKEMIERKEHKLFSGKDVKNEKNWKPEIGMAVKCKGRMVWQAGSPVPWSWWIPALYPRPGSRIN